MPTIYNKRDRSTPSSAEYIGRGSIYGNPYTHLQIFLKNPGTRIVVGTREEAIERYREYFNERIKNDPEFKLAVESLRGKDLVCYCAPRACHGEVIMEYLAMDDEDDE